MPINNMIDPSVAASAYGNSARIAAPASPVREEGVTFSDFMKDKARESVETMRTGEKMSALAVTGEADVTDVVNAVTAADLTLRTVVSLRDRMISAYQEIMRMPI